MRLDKEKDLFNRMTAAAARHFKVNPAIVEKDYHATLLLKRLTRQLPEPVLCGSTSLAKCYGVIHRFSEDLDLTFSQDGMLSKSQRKQIKKEIAEVCSGLGYSLENEKEIRGSRDRNQYVIRYSLKKPAIAARPVILVKTDCRAEASPCEKMPAASMIYDYLLAIGRDDLIRQYKLQPFPVTVQTMERTLIDKILILCDACVNGPVPGNSRHLYDISRLAEQVSFDSDLRSLFQSIWAERETDGRPHAPSEELRDIPALLAEILEKDVYKKDYYSITARLIFDDVSYEEASSGIRALLAGGLSL